MGQGLYAGGVHLVQFFHVEENIVELGGKFILLLFAEFETGEVRHVFDLTSSFVIFTVFPPETAKGERQKADFVQDPFASAGLGL